MGDLFGHLDLGLFQWINSGISNPVFDQFFPWITDLHKTDTVKFFVLPVLCLWILWSARKRGAVILFGLLVTMGISDYAGSTLKHLTLRPRPFELGIAVFQRTEAGGYSFPSNHALNMFCLAVFLSHFFPRAKWLLFTLAILVSISRIYNGVHFPTDVIAGLLGVDIFLGSSANSHRQRNTRLFHNQNVPG